MTDSIDTSEREAEEPRGPFNLPIREMRAEPVPQQPADPLRTALQLALEATPEQLPTALLGLLEQIFAGQVLVAQALPFEVGAVVPVEVRFQARKAVLVSDLEEHAPGVKATGIERPQDDDCQEVLCRKICNRHGVPEGKRLLQICARSTDSFKTADSGGELHVADAIQKRDLERHCELSGCLFLTPLPLGCQVQGNDRGGSCAETTNPVGGRAFQEPSEPIPPTCSDQPQGGEQGDQDTDSCGRSPRGCIVIHSKPPSEAV